MSWDVLSGWYARRAADAVPRWHMGLAKLYPRESGRRVTGNARVIRLFETLPHAGILAGDKLIHLECIVIHDDRDRPPNLNAACDDRVFDRRNLIGMPYVQAREVDEQRVTVGIVRQPLRQVQIGAHAVEIHRLEKKEPPGHSPDVPYDRLKTHVGQDVALDVDSGRSFDQLESSRRQAHHAALGDVEHRCARGRRNFAAEGDLLHALAEFLRPAFMGYAQHAVLDRRLETAGGEGAGKYHLACVLADVDEAAATRQP